ncbi:LysE family translocator [Microbacterium gorillae]|uniref:LysE family translocator n=1 Tax=Microbacterium gorillae TaxID=1231063 RepID=UPI00058CD637|nr:LysE family translocator [Microbacterium gorillae]
MTWEFWVTSIVVTATPGTGALFTVAAALTRGARAGLVAAAGSTLGILPHLTLALSGAAALMTASPVAFSVVKWLGVAYLIYLGWGTWRQSSVLASPSDAQAPPTALRTIGSAVLVNLLNPKLTVFFFVFLPLFVDADRPGAVVEMAALGAVFMGITLAIFAVYALAAARLRSSVIGKPRVMRRLNRGFAVSFVALAGMLAFAHP